jgi:hypothetical protein
MSMSTRTFLAIALAAAASSPARAQFTMSSPAIAGISCDRMEGNRLHIHQHLTILDHGKQVPIPENVGQRPLSHCLYWVHTHTPDGIIHIEAPKDRAFTLGDFFKIWGQPLSKTEAASARAAKGSALKVWVDGKPYAGNPAAIKLAEHTDVVIQAGPPFSKPVRFTDWNGM